MRVDFGCFDESATHPPAPRSPRHAALLLLAGTSPLRRPARGGRPLAWHADHGTDGRVQLPFLG